MTSYKGSTNGSAGSYTGSGAKSEAEWQLDLILSNIDSKQPFLLFPVRLETHFRTIEKTETIFAPAIKDTSEEEKNDVRVRLEFIRKFILENKVAGVKILNIGSTSMADRVNRLFESYYSSIDSLRKTELFKMRDCASEMVSFLGRRTMPPKKLTDKFADLLTCSERLSFPGMNQLLVQPGSSRTITRNQKQICVRIIPDEVMLDYHTEKLSDAEIKDGQFFWLQWYIASGSPKREFEAWEVLCSKYDIHRASWICRCTRPKDIEKYRKEQPLFYRRPYTEMTEIDSYCEDIYNNLAEITLDESRAVNKQTGEYTYEYNLRQHLSVVKENLFKIDSAITSCEWIVDYLYDNIKTAVSYLSRRLESFSSFYQKFPGVYDNNRRTLELWDIDYTLLQSFIKDVNQFLDRLEDRRITLDDMVNLYLKDETIFPELKAREDVFDLPGCNVLPDRFFFIGEIANGKKSGNEDFIYAMGKPVRKNLQMGVDPNEKGEPFKIDESTSDLKVQGGLDWMFDYDKAVDAGMAITVDIDSDIDSFNYIYVLGVNSESAKDPKALRDLFLGHIYSSSGIELLSAGAPTNLVDGGPKSQSMTEEELLEEHFNIEVENKYSSGSGTADAIFIANLFKQGYEDIWARVSRFDNTQINNQRVAFKALGYHIAEKYKDTDLYDGLINLADHISRYVRPLGSLPALRIDNTPYGILPVTDFYSFRNAMESEKNRSDVRYLREAQWVSRAKQILTYLDPAMQLSSVFHDIREESVISPEKIKEKPEHAFMEMAGQTPHSVSFVKRQAISSPLIPTNSVDVPNHPLLKELADKSYFSAQRIANAYESTDIKEYEDVVRKALPEATEEQVHILASSFLDIMTYRVDAWMTSTLQMAIDSGDFAAPAVGAFGWVFNLKENKRVEVKDKESVIKKMKLDVSPSQVKIMEATDSAADPGHFVLAPSIQHALTAAVLRSAFIKNKRSANDSHISVNLSSMRARQALRMIDGLKSGMSTSVILGADLERYMHEACKNNDSYKAYNLDKYIYPLRQMFPLSIDIEAANDDPRANEYTMQVINGEALLNTFLEKWNWDGQVSKWLENNRNSLSWYTLLKKEDPTIESTGAYKGLFRMVERVVDSYDALNDILLSEGVHRLVMGDKSSYYAISNFLAKGEGNLPDMSILESPMERVVVSHKAAIALPSVYWTSDKPLSLAEPSVNHWVGENVGDMDDILFTVRTIVHDVSGTDKVSDCVCSLKEVGVTPIEYLYLSGFENTFQNYLEIKWRALNKSFENDVQILESCEGLGYGKTDLRRNRLRLQKVKDIVLRSRALKPSDFLTQICEDVKDESLVNIDELSGRYNALVSNLDYLMRDMLAWTKEIENVKVMTNEQVLRAYSLMCDCVETGIVNNLQDFNPKAFADGINPILYIQNYEEARECQKALAEDFGLCLEELAKRINAARAQLATSEELISSQRYIEAIKTLTFKNFKVVPGFFLEPGPSSKQEDELKYHDFDSIIRSGVTRYSNMDLDALDQWQDELSEVRDGMRSWNNLCMYQSALGMDIDDTAIIQMDSDGVPFFGNWLGAEVKDESELKDTDSIVLYNKSAFVQGKTSKSRVSKAGLLLDSWLEYIPYKKHSAGLVFHADKPDAEAPQTMLYVMHPEMLRGTVWNSNAVLRILSNTRFLMMNRAVEPDHLYNCPKIYDMLPLVGRVPTSFRNTTSQRSSGGRLFTGNVLDDMCGGNNLK